MCRHCGKKFIHYVTTQIERISRKHTNFHTCNSGSHINIKVDFICQLQKTKSFSDRATVSPGYYLHG